MSEQELLDAIRETVRVELQRVLQAMPQPKQRRPRSLLSARAAAEAARRGSVDTRGRAVYITTMTTAMGAAENEQRGTDMARTYNDNMTRDELENLVADWQDDLIRELAGDNARIIAEDPVDRPSYNLDNM